MIQKGYAIRFDENAEDYEKRVKEAKACGSEFVTPPIIAYLMPPTSSKEIAARSYKLGWQHKKEALKAYKDYSQTNTMMKNYGATMVELTVLEKSVQTFKKITSTTKKDK